MIIIIIIIIIMPQILYFAKIILKKFASCRFGPFIITDTEGCSYAALRYCIYITAVLNYCCVLN